MVEQVQMNASQKVISTKLTTNYNVIFEDCKLLGIFVEDSTGSTLYYFDDQGKQPKVTRDILENALRALLSYNHKGFDLLCACFYDLKQKEEYFSIAIKVFKEHWNELYNLVIADDVFQRERSFDEIDVMYDFFAEN